jgi:predicted permease
MNRAPGRKAPRRLRPDRWLIALVGVIVPRRLRADWRQEWEAELRWRELMLAEWERLDWRTKLDLLRRSLGALRDALLLQPKRLEDEMFQDLRYGARMLLKHKGFTVVAVLTLALGIGANTAIFSLASALLLRPLPVPQPEQVVAVGRGDGMADPLSYPDFLQLRERGTTFSGLAVHTLTGLSFSDGDRSATVAGELVSANYFDVLGVRPALGRAFTPEDDRAPGAHPVAVVTHRFWQRHLAGDGGVIGKTILLNRRRFTVVGVAPAGFAGTNTPFAVDVWMPAMMLPQMMPNFAASLGRRRDELFSGLARLKPGVTLAQAEAEIETINRHLELADPRPGGEQADSVADRALKLSRVQGISIPHFRRMARVGTALLFAVVGTVLLIACANVANLLLARAAARRKEIAVRLALGASRARLVRQLLTESALLAALGAAVGLLFALWLNRALAAFEPPLPGSWNFELDLRLDAAALVFTLALSVVTALAFGLLPAWQASKPDLTAALKDEAGAEGRRAWRRWLNPRDALVVAQVAVSLVLLISAGLFIRSLHYARRIDPGFETKNRLTLELNLEMQGYDEAKVKAFARQAVERLAALPGVVSASAVNALPLGVRGEAAPVFVEGREVPARGREPYVEDQIVGPDYLRTMGTRLLGGRDFTARDAEGAPRVAIINEAMARRLFPGEEAIGKRFRVGRPDAAPWEVVGVAADVMFRLDEEPRPAMYRPLAQQGARWVTLVAHTAAAPQSLAAGFRREVQALDATLPAQEVKTLEAVVSFSLWPTRMAAGLLSAFSLLGLLLASIGIYGVMSYAVARRTREIGVRMALGARGTDVLRLILRRGVALTLTGTVIGLALALAAVRLLAGLLYGVKATDPLTFGLVSLFLIGVAVAACFVPARRATKVDPLVALRHE